jgi:dihydrofolate reductase
MAKVIAGMSMSLDGYINDASGSVAPLYPDFYIYKQSKSLLDAIQNTYEMSENPNWYAGNYEFQVPLFIVTHHPPKIHPKETSKLTITFVPSVEEAIEKARYAAGRKEVCIVGGASTIQQALAAKLIDELQIDIIPVLLGKGVRFFDHFNSEKITLKKISVTEPTTTRTELKFAVSYE